VTRLLPGMAFDVVYYAAGLTSMGFGRFIVATAIGVAPKTFVESYLGQQAPQYAWMLLVMTGLVMGGLAVGAFLRRMQYDEPSAQRGATGTTDSTTHRSDTEQEAA